MINSHCDKDSKPCALCFASQQMHYNFNYNREMQFCKKTCLPVLLVATFRLKQKELQSTVSEKQGKFMCFFSNKITMQSRRRKSTIKNNLIHKLMLGKMFFNTSKSGAIECSVTFQIDCRNVMSRIKRGQSIGQI